MTEKIYHTRRCSCWKKFNLLKYTIFIILSLIQTSCLTSTEPTYTARKGYLDLTQWQPENHRKIKLIGEWEFYWKQLISPNHSATQETNKTFFYLPGLWNKHKPENRLFNGDGYATFRLKLLLPKKLNN